jgi:hypothetical protein
MEAIAASFKGFQTEKTPTGPRTESWIFYRDVDGKNGCAEPDAAGEGST